MYVHTNILCVLVLISQLCPMLCNPMDCSVPGSSVRGSFQARKLIPISFYKGSSQPMDRTQASGIADRFFTIWATVYVIIHWLVSFNSSMFLFFLL